MRSANRAGRKAIKVGAPALAGAGLLTGAAVVAAAVRRRRRR
ncbi:hypothetical protein [Fodinicola acaciae]|nr:hypothetical protein [Fodinicola acaciae]